MDIHPSTAPLTALQVRNLDQPYGLPLGITPGHMPQTSDGHILGYFSLSPAPIQMLDCPMPGLAPSLSPPAPSTVSPSTAVSATEYRQRPTVPRLNLSLERPTPSFTSVGMSDGHLHADAQNPTLCLCPGPLCPTLFPVSGNGSPIAPVLQTEVLDVQSACNLRENRSPWQRPWFLQSFQLVPRTAPQLLPQPVLSPGAKADPLKPSSEVGWCSELLLLE